MIKTQKPHIKFVFHDAFHSDVWEDMFADDDHEDVIMDTHRYLAWGGQHEDIGTYCDEYGRDMAWLKDNSKYDVWVGEWALATDVCATWLGGFNDANTDATRECQRVDCPYSYLDEHAVDFDRTKASLGPVGYSGAQLTSDHALIKEGKCAIDSDFYDDSQVARLGGCIMDIFNGNVEGHFMWTVRNELEPRWNYITSYDKGWINQNTSTEEIVQE